MKHIFLLAQFLLFGMVPVFSGVPEKKVDVSYSNRRLLRADGEKRFVLLPVEDAAPESEIRVLADTRTAAVVKVRLAVTRVDYYVPLDLAPYSGKTVLLDIRSSAAEDDVRNNRASVWTDNIRQSDVFTADNTELYRPSYHHTPQYGWMNDPNGMFYADGTWHLFFQYGPYGSTWNNMTWGHSTSTDLTHWTRRGNAISPDGLGTVFSGSAVIDKTGSAGFGENAVVALYTQDDLTQMQSLSYSTDGGETFSAYAGNPVLVLPYEARDPKVFRHEQTGKWIMVLASAPEHEVEFYSSDNLSDWTFESRFGRGYGCQDGVWECPDMMELGIRGTDEKRWVLVCNINPGGPNGGSATQYFTGTFDGHEFVCDTAPEVTRWADYGKDHYAAVSWNNAPDGRHTMIAWMSNWQYAAVVPTVQYRSADTLPRDAELFRDDTGALRLALSPAEEVGKIRGKAVSFGSFNVSANGVRKAIPESARWAYELDLDINAGGADRVYITLSNAKGEKTEMVFDPGTSTLSMDRSASGITDFSPDFPCATAAPCPAGKTLGLRLFFDHSSIEVFESLGRFAMTNLVFPTLPYDGISFRSEGGRARITSAKIYEMK